MPPERLPVESTEDSNFSISVLEASATIEDAGDMEMYAVLKRADKKSRLNLLVP